MEEKRRGSHRWIAAALVTGLLASATVAGLLIAQTQSQRREAIAQRFDTRHTTASRFMQAYIDQTEARDIRLARSEFTGAISQARFIEVTKQSDYSTAVLINGAGRLIAISPASPGGLGQRADSQVTAFRSALDGTPTATDVLSPGGGHLTLVGFAVPFNTPNGRRVFAGGYTISNTPLQPFVVSALSTYRTSHVYLLDSAGVVISADRTVAIGQPLSRTAAPLATAISRHPTGYLGSRDQRQHYVTGLIEGTQWRLVFTLDTNELFASLTPGQKWSPWAALVGFILLSLGIIALFVRALNGRVQAEEEHARQETILDTASDAFIGMDQAGLITDWNSAATKLLGWTREEAMGRPAIALIVPAAEREAGLARLQRFVATGVTQTASDPITFTAQHRGGQQIPMEMTVSRTMWQGSWQFHAFMRDISERIEHETLLRELALTDALTGLANRRAFMANLEQAHARATRHGSELAVLYADVDAFKSINDSYGHAAGDAILVQVADRLRAQFRTEDTIGRLGGDEFAVICEDFTNTSPGLTERLRDVLARPYTFRSEPIRASVSVGLAAREENESVEQLLERADMTMYQAKAAGHRS